MPDRIRITFTGPVVAVGYDWDGRLVPIDELTYAPPVRPSEDDER